MIAVRILRSLPSFLALTTPFASFKTPLAFRFGDKTRFDEHSKQESTKRKEEESTQQAKEEPPQPQEQQSDRQEEEDSKSRDQGKQQKKAEHEPIKMKKFSQLIDMNTQHSLRQAQIKVEEIQKKIKETSSQVEQMRKEIQYLKQAMVESQLKSKKLLDSIEEISLGVEQSKKRAQREVDESSRFAVTKIAKELLEVADCLANCKKFATAVLAENQADEFCQQIVQCQVEMQELLRKHEIQEFDPMGQPYNPNTQESLLQIPAQPGYPADTVGVVMRTGYLINGRLLRSARVGVFV